MKLLPAIDLIGGRCVRLAQGDFGQATHYAEDPAAALERFADAGAVEVHVVDLDGARAGEPRQHELLRQLVAEARVAIQVAGGFRTFEQVESLIMAGAERVVIGSLALSEPETFVDMLGSVGPDRLTLALDVRVESGEPMVATHGWSKASGRSLHDVLKTFPTVRHLLVTDISRDGMMAGPNVALMTAIAMRYPDVELQASGGVATLFDLTALKSTGAARAIVGKAIWERSFTVIEGLRHAGG